MKNKALFIKAAILIVFVPMVFTGCVPLKINTTYLQREFGINEKDFTVIEEQDTHGGFHGDGTYHISLDCSDNKEKIYKTINDWSELPLSENLQLRVYGGEKDGCTYGFKLAEETNIPTVNNGYYCFLDRHSEATDKHSDIELFNRYSYNFSLAIYDADTDILYYIREDT